MNGVGRGDNQQKKDKLSVLTRETAGMTMLLFSTLLFFIAVTGGLVFGDIGVAITAFFVGIFGWFLYPLLILLVYTSIVLIFGKKLIPARWVVRFTLLAISVFLIIHTATDGRFADGTFQSYMAGCWNAASETVAKGTGGGVLFGLVVYPVRLLLTTAGAYVLFAVIALLALFFLLLLTPLRSALKIAPYKEREQKNEEGEEGVSFSDLETPEKAARAEPAEPQRTTSAPAATDRPSFIATPVRPSYTAPAQQPVSRQPVQNEQDTEDVEITDPYRQSREILFGSNPVYGKNLIFDSDSAFNRGTRRSNMEPELQRPAQQPESSPYTSSFTSSAESGRDPMPRRVVTPEPQDEINYPQTPAFRAPSQPVQRERDFYSRDVQPERPAVSEPTPVVPETLNDPAPATVEPTTRGTSFLDFLGRRDSAPVQPEPEQPSDSSPRRTLRLGFGLEDPAETNDPEPAEDMFPRRDRGYDDLGRSSRGFEEPTRGFEDTSHSSRGFDEPTRGFEDTSRSTRGFEEPTRGFEDTSRSSRGFDEPTRGRDDRRSAANLFDDDNEEFPSEPSAPAAQDETSLSRGERGMGRLSSESTPAPAPAPAPKPEPKPKKKHVWKKYKRPDIELLETYADKPNLSQEEMGRNSGIILDTLRRYRIETEVTKVTVGPQVARYDLAMPEGATINSITKYSDEIELALKRTGVTMFANSERGCISVMVPNDKASTVGLKSLLMSNNFQKKDPEALTFAIGLDLEGESVCGNITDMTHILVAGTTGSGKSVVVHAMIMSLLFKYSPEELRFIFIDPKQTEFIIYENLPHLMINEIITEPSKAVVALNWAIKEMERRYSLFKEKTRAGIPVAKIDEYNDNLTEDEERMPKIVIVVDEFSDLMATAKKEVEDRIARLAAKARAAGIHLVIATQRPSVDVITGVIRSNLPTRIALRVDSDLNSRIIIDESGAEKLLGKGDLLLKVGGKNKRVQGAFMKTSERLKVVNFIKENNETYFDEEATEYINRQEGAADSAGGGAGGGDGSVDKRYIQALAAVIRAGQASISLVQRKCGFGYAPAGKMIEWMESQGYISAFEGAKARKVLITQEEFDSKYGGSLD